MVDTTPLGRLADVIHAVAPHADAATWSDVLAAPMRAAGITTAPRIAMFVAQVSVESAGFSTLSENLNYSAARLCQVWPSRFSDEMDARMCAYSPETLANRVYCSRMGNGPTESGDGWRFRGAGLIQLTGRSNHEAFARSVGKGAEECADWVRTPAGAAVSACWFWTRLGLNTIADAGDVGTATRRINGGTNGLAARQSAFAAARAVFLAP